MTTTYAPDQVYCVIHMVVIQMWFSSHSWAAAGCARLVNGSSSPLQGICYVALRPLSQWEVYRDVLAGHLQYTLLSFRSFPLSGQDYHVMCKTHVV